MLVTKNNFEKICPMWSQGRLDMRSHQYCIVGGAYGFNDNYCNPESAEYCLDCKIFSLRFNTDSRNISSLKDKFIHHWNTVHVYR